MTTRRDFLIGSAAALAASSATSAAPSKSIVGLVHSTHKKLLKPVEGNHPLDYPLVRDMVWNAIKYGKPKAGSLEKKIKPGSWVVLKVNYCYLGTQPGYRTGDLTDMRVWRAVAEYVARYSKAKRITIAEGGSYRRLEDPKNDRNVVQQNGQRVDRGTYVWNETDWPGMGGATFNAVVKDLAKQFPDKQFDQVDLAYDVVRDAAGQMKLMPVPVRNGVGSYSNQKEYYVTNTILNCDFLISVPVSKVHENCGVTCCFKNYVGTGPRIAYGEAAMTNQGLHNGHSVDTRIDPFIGDLAAFHPPDYNVVDMIRGLQATEHNNRQPDQMIQNNLVLAGEDPVAVDAVVDKMMGFKAVDIDYQHMAVARGIGTYDMKRIEVIGDEPDKYNHKFAKPRTWYARSNRDWKVTGDPAADARNWKRFTSFGDMLDLKAAAGDAPNYACTATVKAEGARKGFLWLGLTGKGTVELNGRQIMAEEGVTRFRAGQFRQEVELRPGDNQFVFKVQPADGRAAIAALLVNADNNGDSLEGATWSA
jgi:uncharacterized protein (DUF362 family)